MVYIEITRSSVCILPTEHNYPILLLHEFSKSNLNILNRRISPLKYDYYSEILVDKIKTSSDPALYFFVFQKPENETLTKMKEF